MTNEKLKHIFSQFKENDYYSKVNLHIHSCFSDGEMTPDEIIKQATEKKIEYISITDHNTIKAYNNITMDIPETLMLIHGVEFDCWLNADFMHILGYGIDISNKKINNMCAKNDNETKLDIIRIFSLRKAHEVISVIKEAGGIAVLAHPACCWSINMDNMIKKLVSFGLDGIELHYPYKRHRKIFKFHSLKEIKKIIEKHQLISTGGNDCHKRDLLSS